jgi:uncharacterized repeat protein (TIGR02543 family)
MKRTGAFWLGFLLVSNSVLRAGVNHTVTGRVFNFDLSVPANGTVTFNAYITSRPGEVQTQNSVGAGYSSGYWFINAGNFSSDWHVGDVLRVNFTNTAKGVQTTLQFTLTSNDPDITPDVTFPPRQFQLTMAVSPSGGGSTTPSAGVHSYNEGTVVNVSASPAAGFRFVNWSGDVADPNSASTTVTMNANRTATANFQRTYTLTMAVNPSGGGSTSPAVGSYTHDEGAVVNLSASPASGYVFVNWTGGVANPGNPSTTVTMNSNKTITANFARLYTLTMAVNPGGSGTTDPAAGDHSVVDGTVVNLTATAASGYVFVNWTGGVANPSSPTTTVTVNANKTVTANFAVARTLTIGVSPAGGGTTSPGAGTHTYAHGTMASISAYPAVGYRFLNWSGDVANPNSASTTVTMDADKAVIANFKRTYNLTMSVSPSGGGSTSPAAGVHTFDEGSVVNLSATPAIGYRFVNWTGDVANPNSANTSVTMNSSKTVRANFIRQYNLTIAANPPAGGSTSPVTGTYTVDDGTVVSLTAAPSSGYVFVNWTGEVANPNSAGTTVTVNANKTVTANFSHQYTLTVSVSPAGSGTTVPVAGGHPFADGTVVNLSASAASGYVFVNWTGEVANPNSAGTTVTVNANKSVTANFAVARTLTLGLNPPAGGSTTPPAGSTAFVLNTVVPLSAVPAAGYRFVNWTGEVANPNNPNTTVTMDANRTVTANFRRVRQLTLGVNPAGGGSTTPAPGIQSIDDGTVVGLTAVPGAGYRFVDWSGDVADPASAGTSVTMDADQTVTANFRKVHTLTLAVSPTGGGSTSPAPGAHTLDDSSVVSLLAVPAAGYLFLRWDGDVADSSSSTTTLTVHASEAVTAVFGKRYTLNMAVSPAGAGTTTPAAGAHAVAGGSVIEISAAPSAGYRFAGWTGSVEEPDSASTTVTVSSSVTVTARFALVRMLSMSVRPPGGGTTLPEQGIHARSEGELVTVTALPNPGFRFLAWTGEVADSTSPTTTVRMHAAQVVIANFVEARTLTVVVNPAGSGSTVPPAGTHPFDDGMVVILSATPSEGYRFAGWTGDVIEPNQAETSVALAANKTVTANFIGLRTLTVSADPPGGGTTVSAAGDHVKDVGTVVPLTASAAPGFRFAGWVGDVSSPGEPATTVTLEANKSVTARFAMEDLQAPTLRGLYPPPAGSAIPLNTMIQFTLEDPINGVDLSSLLVTVNDNPVLVNGLSKSLGSMTVTSLPQGVTVHCHPASMFAQNIPVTVRIACQDNSVPPNPMTMGYTFGTGFYTVMETGQRILGPRGGVLTDDSTQLRITVPEGALREDVELTVGICDTVPALPDTLKGVAVPYHFGPDGLQFSDSVTIRLPYSAVDLHDAGVEDPMKLPVYYFLTRTGSWIRLNVVDASDGFVFVKVKEFCVLAIGKSRTSGIVSPDPGTGLPARYDLAQNYPNPFNPGTVIQYSLARAGWVMLDVVNLRGQRIRRLVDRHQAAGWYTAPWDGLDDRGALTGSGVYVCVLKVNGATVSRKMTKLQ